MKKDQQLSVNGIRVSYTDAGTGDLPLILIHPFPFHKAAWQPQVDALKDSARVISYDIRGFGQSEQGSEKTSIQLYADDLIQLMDALGIEQAVVCGLSMGGYILLNAVERYPQRFKGIVLADTQCLADSKEGREKRQATIKEIEEKGLEEFAAKFMKNAFTEQTQAQNKTLVESTLNMILENSPEAITAALGAMAGRAETCSKLSDIAVPALILCGKEDKVTPPSLSEFLFTNIPGAKLNEIEQAAHLSHLEQPASFNALLHKFLSTFW